ncbi:MAG: NUDIX hydrolase [bacterium]
MSKQWKKLSSKKVYENPWMKVFEDDVVGPDGKKSIYGYIDKPHYVLAIPIYKKKFYLVEQYRYPVQERGIEFPQGGNENGREPQEQVKIELQEETGLITKKIKKLGFLWLSNGHSTQGFYIYLIHCKKKGKTNFEGTEADMKIKKYSKKKLEKMLADGTIKDSPTVAAYGLYLLKKKRT